MVRLLIPCVDFSPWPRIININNSLVPDNLEQRKGIEKIVGPHIIQLIDGTELENVDVILFCTGYHYTFPFLDRKCQLEVNNRVVSPLYKYVEYNMYISVIPNEWTIYQINLQ